MKIRNKIEIYNPRKERERFQKHLAAFFSRNLSDVPPI